MKLVNIELFGNAEQEKIWVNPEQICYIIARERKNSSSFTPTWGIELIFGDHTLLLEARGKEEVQRLVSDLCQK